jgi:hypothetical protein
MHGVYYRHDVFAYTGYPKDGYCPLYALDMPVEGLRGCDSAACATRIQVNNVTGPPRI